MRPELGLIVPLKGHLHQIELKSDVWVSAGDGHFAFYRHSDETLETQLFVPLWDLVVFFFFGFTQKPSFPKSRRKQMVFNCFGIFSERSEKHSHRWQAEKRLRKWRKPLSAASSDLSPHSSYVKHLCPFTYCTYIHAAHAVLRKHLLFAALRGPRSTLIETHSDQFKEQPLHM